VQTIEGITIEAATDRAGTLELLSAFFAYPKWRGNAFLNYGIGAHNLRVNYHSRTPSTTTTTRPAIRSDACMSWGSRRGSEE
jgi:hypothetical protein